MKRIAAIGRPVTPGPVPPVIMGLVLRSLCGFALAWLTLADGLDASGQTILLSEGFEGVFPGLNGWSVGDANALSGTAYWDDVFHTYGSVEAHTGNWKGYCAAITNGAFNPTAVYTNNM